VFGGGVAVQPAHVLRLASRASAVGRHHRRRRVAAEPRHRRRAAANQAHHPGRIGPLPLPPLPRRPNPLVSVSSSFAASSRARFALLGGERERSGLGLICLAGFFVPRRGRGWVQKSAGVRGGGGARTRVIHARGPRGAVRRVHDGPRPLGGLVGPGGRFCNSPAARLHGTADLPTHG
jgi:hypothetical protein